MNTVAKTEQLLSKEDRLAILEQTLKAQGIGLNNFRRGGSFGNYEFLPTGQYEVDAILGEGGGIPRGTLIEFCGESQSGKTYLALKLLKEAQDRGEWGCFVNVENTFYPPRAEAIGINVNDPLSFRLLEDLSTAEEFGNAIFAIVDSALYSVVIVDSISALIPDADYDKNLEDNAKFGAHATFVKRFTRKLINKCSKTQTIVVLINQQYMGAGKMPNTYIPTATGGNAMNYFTHMRLWINKIGGQAGAVVDSEGNIIGGKSKLMVKKTRYGEPGLVTEFPIMFGKAEADPIAEFFYRAKAKGFEYIKEVRKVFKYTDPDTGEIINSKDPIEMIKLLQNNPAPSKRTAKDTSKTAFEYICGRLKMNETVIAKLQAACDAGTTALNSSEADEDNEEMEQYLAS